MKKSELQQIIREEISGVMNEGNLDIISRSLDILDKVADMAIQNPIGNVVELANIVKKHTAYIRKSL